MNEVDPATLLGRLGIEFMPRGERLHALCPSPDHDDRKPSWAAWSDDLGRFRHRCLSCGFGGGAVRLVRAALQCSTPDAYDFLAGTASAGPPPPLRLRIEVRDRWRKDVDKIPEEVWFADFAEWPSPARVYLEKRGLGAEHVKRWGMGYVVDGTLRARIWVPVRDLFGRLVSWTARSFVGDEPKYLSSDEPASHALLGESLWAPSTSTCVVVEGPFDAVAVDAAVPEVSVGALRGTATSGDAIDPGQASKLVRFERVVVATDPDKAGRRAAALLSGLARWTHIERAELPRGEDPAFILQTHGPAALRAALGF